MSLVRSRSRNVQQDEAFEDLLQRCRNAYEIKDYVQSIAIVATAMQAAESSLQPCQKIEILDFKCLSHVKLNTLEAALDVAKTMIRLNKCCGLGYCRVASIEKARKNYPVAMQFLDHGFHRVKDNDKYYKSLTNQRTALQELSKNAIVMSKATDPMTLLPLELLQFVLVHLDHRQLVRMTRVSKTWRRILVRLEPLFDTIDFRYASRPVSRPELRAALARVGRLKTLAIDKLSSPAGEVFSQKVFRGPAWVHLEHLFLNDKNVVMRNAPFEKLSLRTIHLGLDTKVETDEAFRILGKCTLLTEAIFRRIAGASTEAVILHEHLQALELGNAFDLAAFSILPEHFSKYPHLRTLTVNGASSSMRSSWDLRGNPHLIKLDTYACIIQSIHLPPTLEQWLWDGTEVRCFSLFSMLQPPPTPLPNLHTVCFSGDNALEALSFLQASKVTSGQIRRAGLHNRQNGDTLTAALNVLDMLSSVEDFSFESESLLDRHFHGFAARYPDLVTLQLAAPRITGAFIADLLKRPNNRIKKLVLKDCGKVERDAIEWARGQGIDVEVHLAKVEVRGGRRLREGWF